MTHPTKEIRCACGHVSRLTSAKMLCVNCGKYVFYDPREQRRHRQNTIYMLAIMALGIGMFLYFFIEIVAVPFMPR